MLVYLSRYLIDYVLIYLPSNKRDHILLSQTITMYRQTVIQFNISGSSVSSLNLASLSMNECDSTTQSQDQRLSNGWGSQETRKAYTSLHELADCQDNSHHGKPRVQRSNSRTSTSSTVVDQQAYDFFVSDDEMDCDENFW
jgi:hypothetical protein